MTSIIDSEREWGDLLDTIPTDIPTRDAAAMLADKLGDAVQAQRPWARTKLAEATHAGLAKTWRSHVQKQRPKVKTKRGNVKTVGGIKRVADGEVAYVQVPLDGMAPEELARYRTMFVANLQVSAATVKVLDRLIELCEKCPTARNAAEACEKLGLDLADVMAEAA